jgi:hypothetical protein
MNDPGPPQTGWRAIESFAALPREDQWRHLVRLQRALVQLDADVRRGRFGEDIGQRDSLLRELPLARSTAGDEHEHTVRLSSSDPPLTDGHGRELHELLINT